MTLSKTLVQTSLQAAIADPGIDDGIKAALEDYFDRFPTLGGITPAQQAAKVETFLNSDPTNWSLLNLQRVASYLIKNWENLPA